MLYVECYADELLAQVLGVPRREVRHECGKGNIFRRLRQLEAGKGLVDEDPSACQPAEWLQYRVVAQQGSVTLRQHVRAEARQVIVLSPRLEEWLYERAEACQIRPEAYGLPRSAEMLKKFPRYESKPAFRKFLEDLYIADAEVQWVSTWIR
jgi:hypothetical protein